MDINSPQNVTVVDGYCLASTVERIIAFLIDILVYSIIYFLVFTIFQFIGLAWLAGIIAVSYLILRDNIPFLNYQSIGKKIMKLKVIRTNDEIRINLLVSLKRNFLFLPILFPLGVSFIYTAATVTFFLILIEVYLMYTSPDNQRLGDQYADTLVIQNYLKF